MLSGITLPAFSELDPALAGEGSLDPLGLAPLADELADLLVPNVRARMARVRFLTAIAVGAVVCEEFADDVAADGLSGPAICFEWLTIEAFVRRLGNDEWTTNIPGSRKARSVVGAGGRLSAGNYLKTPTVFGFHGIYQPLALSFGIIDRSLLPGERCGELVTAWERDQGLDGFFDGTPGSTGRNLRIRLSRAVHDSLVAGRCAASPSAQLFGQLSKALHPDWARSRERAVLRGWLLDAEYPERSELAGLLAAIDLDDSERDLTEAVTPDASPGLEARLSAVRSYEAFAALVAAVMATLQFVSTGQGLTPVDLEGLANHDVIKRASAELPGLFSRALVEMAPFDLADRLEQELGVFGDPHPPQQLPAVVLWHHEQRQAAKPPRGKRSWFDSVGSGVIVRAPYVIGQPPVVSTEYLHPMRVRTLQRFMDELT